MVEKWYKLQLVLTESQSVEFSGLGGFCYIYIYDLGTLILQVKHHLKNTKLILLGEAHWNCPPCPGTRVTICVRFITGGPGKEHEPNKPPPTGRVQERSKGDTTCPTTSQNPSLWHPSWLNKVCTTRKNSESEWLAKDNLETNPITIKLWATSHMAEQFFWFPLPYCSPSGRPLPIKSRALSAHLSPGTIHFQVLDKSPVSGPERGPLSCNISRGLQIFPGILLFVQLEEDFLKTLKCLE